MTKRTVAKTRAHSKPRTEKPVDSEIRRAARRAGIEAHPKTLSFADVREAVRQGLRDAKLGAEFKAATGVDPEHVEVTPAPSNLTPEDEAILAKRTAAGVVPFSGRRFIQSLRGSGVTENGFIAFALREEAHRLELLASEYRPVADGEKLAAALEVIDLAEASFESSGHESEDPERFMLDAIACAQDDIEALDALASDERPPMLARRAELRIDLAVKIHEFRKAHGYPKAAGEQAEGGAS